MTIDAAVARFKLATWFYVVAGVGSIAAIFIMLHDCERLRKERDAAIHDAAASQLAAEQLWGTINRAASDP